MSGEEQIHIDQIKQNKSMIVPTREHHHLIIPRSESVAIDCYPFVSVQARVACFRSYPSCSYPNRRVHHHCCPNVIRAFHGAA